MKLPDINLKKGEDSKNKFEKRVRNLNIYTESSVDEIRRIETIDKNGNKIDNEIE